MRTTLTIIISISIGLLSCTNSRTESTVKNENIDSVSNQTELNLYEQTAGATLDTVKRFDVDDYPVTNDMLADKTSDNSSHKRQSGQTFSYDHVWFSNDTLKQTLVFELATDYHRLVTYHFYNTDIPIDLINRMNLNTEGGELATEKQKIKDFNGFINQTTKIYSSYFITEKGLRLGDIKQKAFDLYGKPSNKSIINGIEKMEWKFLGDILYDGKTDLRGKPLAKNNFGHQAILFFKEAKLFAQILHNDIP